MKNEKRAVLIASFLVISFSPRVKAEETAAAPVKPWNEAAEVSLVDTTGNSKTLSASLKNKFDYSWTQTTLETAFGMLYAEDDGIAKDEEYFANEKVDRSLEGKDYIYEKAAWDRERFSGIRTRTELSTGLGRKILDLPSDKFNAEVGLGYIDEEHTDLTSDKFAAGRGYAKYTHTFSPTARFSQDIEYLPSMSDGNDYRVNTETALTTVLTTSLSLKTSYDWQHNNKPAAGFGQNDSTTSVALVVNY